MRHFDEHIYSIKLSQLALECAKDSLQKLDSHCTGNPFYHSITFAVAASSAIEQTHQFKIISFNNTYTHTWRAAWEAEKSWPRWIIIAAPVNIETY